MVVEIALYNSVKKCALTGKEKNKPQKKGE